MESSVASLQSETHCGKKLASLWTVSQRSSTNNVFVCVSRYGLFLGSRETFLAAFWGLLHTSGLRRRLYTQSKL